MKEEIPKIRFEGFTKVWEERKLGEVTDVKTGPFGSVLHAEDYVSDGIPIITTEHFKSGRLPEVKDGLPQVSDEDYSRLSGYTLETDDIVFSRVGSVDINALVTSSQNQWLFSGRVLRVRPCQGVDSMFLHTLLETGGIRNDIISRAVGQTMPSINTEILKDTLLCLPQDIEEQKAIGEYFQKLEDLIMLHQSKCDETKELKKYMLQKMFPKNDEKIPEIRFKGFTGGWEQRKLGELVERVGRKNSNNESSLPLTISAQYGLIDQITYFNNRVASRDVSDYYLILNGEFAYNKSTSDGFPFGAVKRLDLYEKGVLSTLYIVFRIKNLLKTDSDFLTTYFDTDRWHKGVSERATEGARNHGLLNISVGDFFDIDLCIPKFKEEQDIIGAFFQNLDHIITLHQNRCNALKEVKKYMMQNMFPQKG